MNLNLTILGQAIAFALFVWFCMKYVWPPLTGALRERQKHIADGLEAAAKSQQDLKKAEDILLEKTEEGRKRAREIIEDAEKRRLEIIENARHEAEAEKQRIQHLSDQQIKQQAHEVREQLQQNFGRLVAQGVSHIVEREVDVSAHNEYIQELVAKL